MSDALGCDYTGHDFGANYPDSICIEGYLWDLDSCDEPGGPLYNGGDMPCPECNHEEFLANCIESAANDGYCARYDGKGRAFPIAREKLRYPQDFEALEAAYLKGWEEANEEEQPS